MKIGIISKPNQKGQIVIPKSIREKLSIDENTPLNIVVKDNGFFVYPVDIQPKLKTKIEKEIYLKILRKNQGSWADDNWEDTKKRRKKIELNASKKRKKIW